MSVRRHRARVTESRVAPQTHTLVERSANMSRRILVSMVMGALMLPASLSFAQEQPAQGQGEQRRDGERRSDGERGGDRGNWQERMAGFMKEQLAVNDEEWKVLQPKLQKVMEARRDAGGFGFFGSRGRGPGGGDRGSDQPQSAAQKASTELRTTLDNKEAKPEEIAAKLKALREAREKAKADLTAAQKELKEVLTQRQEAVLVMMGQLD
jgi:peptidoglycan hydrolase CwlO-like protein